MEIIRHGFLSVESTKHHFFCGHCGCLFVAKYGEFRDVTDKHELGLNDKAVLSSKCPECGGITEVWISGDLHG